jgi:hydrogenase nickel incorporation protein HypA/HybF
VDERFKVHELQVTERILEIVIRHATGHDVSRIVLIRLKIGELSDLEDEWIQRYFDYLSRGTIAENAKLAIQRAPIVLECDDCSRSFEVRKDELGGAECPDCGGSDCRLLSGREYLIENIEVL